jgi:HD-GYP domain-containing protein (c-di-GMP phosphodiesterase class II)
VPTVEASSAAPVHADELAIELVAQARARARLKLGGSEERVALALAAGFLAAATGAAIVLPAVRAFSPATALVAVLAYALVASIRFEVGHGIVLPTQLVLVPMLFALPPRGVPLLVAGGLLLSRAPDLVRKRFALNKLPFPFMDASHSLGPAAVLSLASARPPSWQDAPIYVGALAAQFGMDLVPGTIWSRATWSGITIREHVRSMRISFLVDAALAPVGLVVAIATVGRPWGVLLVLPLVALLKVFARDRQVRIDHALELSSAYRGTAILLGDVIEADDAYTGSHSRAVVDLVVAVADRLGLDSRARRHAELAALLHDIGKVKVPSEIVNKPAPLDDDERALMNTHTLTGEAMLETVGGLLGEVGHVVRSCHEHWDGGGYPDGLAGEVIPLAARIVCACDAWSAMTTDRPYRRALTPTRAAIELRACAGTQFDPQVVAALIAVLDL